MAENQRFFIELSYDGTRYHGWQSQHNAISVQEVLNDALSTVLRQRIETLGCGRTDTGVHAREFFAHFDIVHSPWTIDHRQVHSPWTIDNGPAGDKQSIDHRPSTSDYRPSTMDYGPTLRSLNSILPPDIAIKKIIPVHADAHARFDATLRSYEYHIHFNKNPFRNGYSWLLRDRPNVELMNHAAQMMMEYIDFSCFSKSNTQTKTNNCKIAVARWILHDDGMVFHISADRFLRNMVRAIVGTLLMVGRGEIPPEGIRDIIESKSRGNAGTSVPACGLYLTQVKYPFLG